MVFVVYSRVKDWQLCSIERDYIKEIVAVYDERDDAEDCRDLLSVDNWEEEFFIEEMNMNECMQLDDKKRMLA